MKTTTNKLKASLILLALTGLININTHSAVVMTGTRVIFLANQNEKTVQLQNKDNAPNIIQIWLDKGDVSSTPDTADAPFLANPQIFKIPPNQGQMIRLIFTGQKEEYPKDRESIFYLNFSEIPAIKSVNTDKNKLMVVFRNRIKVFYRPDRLPFPSHEISKHLSYQFISHSAKSKIKITNNSPYFANISEANLITPSKKSQIKKNSMIAPYSTAEWDLPLNKIQTQNTRISLGLINDYGIVITSDLMPTKE